MLGKTRQTSARTAIEAASHPGVLPDAILAGQALSEGNARRPGTSEWPRPPAPPRHAGWAKGCHRRGVLPQNGARDWQGCAATPCCSDAGTAGGVMVRRAILDRGAQPTAHAAGVEAAPGVPGSAGERAERTGQRWRGAGGRWLVLAFPPGAAGVLVGLRHARRRGDGRTWAQRVTCAWLAAGQ